MKLTYAYGMGYRHRQLAYKRRLRHKIWLRRCEASRVELDAIRAKNLPGFIKRHGRKPRPGSLTDELKLLYPLDAIDGPLNIKTRFWIPK